MIFITEVAEQKRRDGKVVVSKRVLFLSVLIIVAVVAAVAWILFRPPSTSEITFQPSSNVVYGGNSSYPGWYGWSFDLKKGDRADISVQASSEVNFYVIPAAAFDTWTNSYYVSQNPGDFFPWNQAIATSGHTISSSLIFTAPSDGKFVVVALNEHTTNPTVTVGGKAYRTGS